MGFLDFLYKPRTKINARYPPSNGGQQHERRTQTHVRSNSVPNRRKVANNGQQATNRSTKATGRTQISSPAMKPSSNRHKQESSAIEDDYTRLMRMESQIDSYIKRHTVLVTELDSVEQNLREIEQEFNEEFDQLVLTSNQKHVLQTGDRVMKKFSALHGTKVHPQSEPVARRIVTNKSGTLPSKSQQPQSSQSNRNSLHIQQKSVSKPPSPIITQRTKQLPEESNHPAVNDLVHAQYALIKTSTPNLAKKTVDQNATADNFYVQQQPTIVDQFSGIDETEWTFYEQQEEYLHQQQNRITSPKMYLNMAMTMHSEHPTVEACFRKIELLRPRILGYKSDHRYRVYHDIHNDVLQLFYRLQNLDNNSRQSFENDINVALCELHNLSGVLERSIECREENCTICNSFNYRTEIQV